MSDRPLNARIQDLVERPSISSTDPAMDTGNVEVSELIAGWFDELGFAVSIQEVPAKANHRNVIATVGSGPGGLILAGHSDTVPYDQGQWSQSPFLLHEDGGRLHGLGTSDMKSFFAVIAEAATRHDLRKLQAPLTVIATADEETGMTGARSLPALHLMGAQVVIGEPTGGRPVRMHKGNTMQRIRLTGRSGHSSDPSNGNSALEGMHDVLGEIFALRAELADRYCDPAFSVPTPTINVGCIHGGDNPNRICGTCETAFDLRILPGMDAAEVLDRIQKRTRAVAERRGLDLSFETIMDIVPPMLTSPSCAVVAATERISDSAAESAPFTTEAPFYRQQGLDVVVWGPGDIRCAHQPNESVDIEQIKRSVDGVSSLIRDFCVDRRSRD